MANNYETQPVDSIMFKIYEFKLLNLIINGMIINFSVSAANSSCLMINLWFLICLTYLSTIDLEIYTIIHMQFDTKLWLTQEAFNMTCFSLTHQQDFNKQIHRIITKLSSKYIYIWAALYSQHNTISSKTHTHSMVTCTDKCKKKPPVATRGIRWYHIL